MVLCCLRQSQRKVRTHGLGPCLGFVQCCQYHTVPVKIPAYIGYTGGFRKFWPENKIQLVKKTEKRKGKKKKHERKVATSLKHTIIIVP